MVSFPTSLRFLEDYLPDVHGQADTHGPADTQADSAAPAGTHADNIQALRTLYRNLSSPSYSVLLQGANSGIPVRRGGPSSVAVEGSSGAPSVLQKKADLEIVVHTVPFHPLPYVNDYSPEPAWGKGDANRDNLTTAFS